MRSLLALSLLFLFGSSEAQFWALGSGPKGCPPVTEKPAHHCQNAYSTCWSPGTKDTDCPGNGFCCFDGCANTCLGVSAPVNVIPEPAQKAPAHNHEYNRRVTAKPKVHRYPKRTAAAEPQRHYPVHPSIGRTITSCPQVAPKSALQCAHARPNCWSRGTPDVDCPNNGLCCFDGCVNTCLAQQRHYPSPPARTTRPPPADPCHPSPCGPGTTCTPNREGNPVCQCLPGLVPKPDTIAGCGPECEYDRDCSYGLVCREQRCVERPDPCSPSPCGPNTRCIESRDGNPVCHCVVGFVPKPDTITGCGPECVVDSDCDRGYVCENQRCVEKDPCDPSPCGPRTTCTVNSRGDPVCNCLPGYVPKPDTITGCGPECTVDADCQHGYMCENYKCTPKQDPCHPSPCGPGTTCRMGPKDNAICECLPGLIPQPDTVTGCGPECTTDYDCGQGFICQNQKCIEKPDPCDPSPCGPGAFCMVNSAGNAICKCEEGLVPMPDTIIGCGPECTRDSDCEYGFVCENQRCIEKPDPCNPSPCGPGTTCEPNRFGNPICKCRPGLVPKPDTITGCGPECEVDADCEYGYECRNQKCVERKDPCDPNPCGMMATCTPKGYDDYECTCPRGTFGDGFIGCQQGECLVDQDCTQDKACIDYYCINPCFMNNTCPTHDFCQVRNHVPVCGDHFDEPPKARTPVVIGGRYDRARPVQRSRSPVVIGGRYNDGDRRDIGISSNSGSGASIIDARSRRQRYGSRRSSAVIGANYRRRRSIIQKLMRSAK